MFIVQKPKVVWVFSFSFNSLDPALGISQILPFIQAFKLIRNFNFQKKTLQTDYNSIHVHLQVMLEREGETSCRISAQYVHKTRSYIPYTDCYIHTLTLIRVLPSGGDGMFFIIERLFTRLPTFPLELRILVQFELNCDIACIGSIFFLWF